jgi:hypothetical protein
MSARFYQVPRSLLRSREHSGLAVAAWCLYESLQAADGGRRPSRARRCWVAEQLGVSERTLDRARAELLADHGDGPFLVRRLRGRNRSALHHVLGLPKQTRLPYAAVPAWSLSRVHAGAGRSEGQVCPETWRAYAVLCDRLDAAGHDLTIARLAEWLGCSPSTARRRLHALEAVGWVRVARADGLWMHVRVITDEQHVDRPSAGEVPDERAVRDRSITPAAGGESPLAFLAAPRMPSTASHPLPDVAVPGEAPSDHSSPDDSPADELDPLAAGELQHRKSADHVSLRERSKSGSDEGDDAAVRPSGSPVRACGTPSVMAAIPLEWQMRMSEHERERVLSAIEAEIGKGRTVAEMTARVRRRLAVWHGRQVRRPVAAALTVVRRGYHCPRPECEDHMLPSGHPCQACVIIGAQINEARSAPPAVTRAVSPATSPAASPGIQRGRPLDSAPAPLRDHNPPSPGFQPGDYADARRRGLALARRQLQARGLPTVDKLTSRWRRSA